METPREKAEQLIKDFRNEMTGPGVEANDKNAYAVAMKCTEEIIGALYDEGRKNPTYWYDVQTEITQAEEERRYF